MRGFGHVECSDLVGYDTDRNVSKHDMEAEICVRKSEKLKVI